MIYVIIQSMKDWLQDNNLWWTVMVFDQTTFRAVAAVILSFLIVVLFGRRTIRALVRLKIGDNPEFDNVDLNRLTKDKAMTPTMGGILIAAAIFFTTVLLSDIREFYVQMALICLIMYAGLGAVDDYLKLTSQRRAPGPRHGLYTWEKLVFQVGWALVLGFFIHNHGLWSYQQAIEAAAAGQPTDHMHNMSHVLNLPFQATWEGASADDLITLGPWAFGILTVLVISGSSNAANLTDGMDGLLSGIMAIVGFAFLILALTAGIESWAGFLRVPLVPAAAELAIVAGAIVGGCLGFLWFNCHPAQVFMGDTGSLPLGALAGYIAVVIRQELLLVLIGGILVAEALSVILQVGYFKASHGSRLFRCAPIHHHFHLAGWTEQQVVVRFWLISALLAALALATLKLH